MTEVEIDHVRKTKEKIRIYINEAVGGDVNCIHSSDDEQEALEYINLLMKKS